MASADDITPAQLDEYLAGEGTARQREDIERYIETRLGSVKLRSVVQAQLEGAEAMVPDPVSALTRLSARIDNAGSTRNLRAPRSGTLRRSVAVFAALGLAAITVVTHMPRRGTTASPRTYVTAPGQQRTVVLPDGSRAQLAAASRLLVPLEYGRSARTVILTGEAYFDVHPHPGAPFVVQTGATSVRVLGTTFTVRRYNNEHTAHVAVMSGRVAAVIRGTPVVLTAGMVARANDSTITVSTARDDAAREAAWMRGQLVFERTPVPVMLATVGRWYGYEFRIADSALAGQTVTTVLSTTPSPQAFAAMRDVLDVSMRFEGRVITLYTHRSRAESSAPVRSSLSSATEVGR